MELFQPNCCELTTKAKNLVLSLKHVVIVFYLLTLTVIKFVCFNSQGFVNMIVHSVMFVSMCARGKISFKAI